MVTPALVVRKSWSEIFEVFEHFSTRPVGRLSARRQAKPARAEMLDSRFDGRGGAEDASRTVFGSHGDVRIGGLH